MQKQELSTLSLALRAGKLILGFDKVVEEIKNKNAKGVFYTEDLSEKSRKELCFVAQQHGMQPYQLRVTMEEVFHFCTKRSGVIALSDEGFAKKLVALAEKSI